MKIEDLAESLTIRMGGFSHLSGRCAADHQAMNKPHFVPAEWDDEVAVWVATSDDVPGLVTEAQKLEALDATLKTMVPELLMANGCMPADGQVKGSSRGMAATIAGWR